MSNRPLIGLVMIVRDEEAVAGRCLDSARGLIDTWTVCDTGSTDRTKEIVQERLDGIPGRLLEHDWSDYGANSTLALAAARGSADWLLRLDADCTLDYHQGLRAWLGGGPDPRVDAWMVELDDHGVRWRLPWLVRGDQKWAYRGAVHEHLVLAGRRSRALLGLTVHHHGDSSHQQGKLERWLELLRPGLQAGDPRDTFYTAETLRYLGRDQEAIALYEARAKMGGWEEEAWYSTYQAACLRRDVDALLDAWHRRPWRHEPLTAAARIAAENPSGDILFLEPPP